MNTAFTRLIENTSRGAWRASDYTIENHAGRFYIRPATDELKRQEPITKQEELIWDFLKLLLDVQKALSSLYDWDLLKNEDTLSYRQDLLFDANLRHVEHIKAMEACANALLPFIKQWGIFGIFWANIAPDSFVYEEKKKDGSFIVYGSPINLSIKQYEHGVDFGALFNDKLPHGYMKIDKYKKHFFPHLSKLPNMSTKEFFQAYSEPVEAIIFNNDFLSMLLHHIRRAERPALAVDLPQVSVQYNESERAWGMSWKYNSLMQALAILYADNLILYKVAACQFDDMLYRPKKPSQQYCSSSCATNVRVRRFREREAAKNAQETPEQ